MSQKDKLLLKDRPAAYTYHSLSILNDLTKERVIQQISEWFDGISNVEESEWTNLRLQISHNEYGENDIFIIGDRLETNEEYSQRLEAERKAAELTAKRVAKVEEGKRRLKIKKELEEKKLYEKLKKKYEPN